MLNIKIKELRKNNNLTQEDLGKKLNVSSTAINYWENGKREPDLDTLKNLSKIFNVTIDYIIGNEKTTTIISQGGNMENRSLTPEEENVLNNALNKTNQIEKLSNEEITEIRNIINWFKQLRK